MAESESKGREGITGKHMARKHGLMMNSMMPTTTTMLMLRTITTVAIIIIIKNNVFFEARDDKGHDSAAAISHSGTLAAWPGALRLPGLPA